MTPPDWVKVMIRRTTLAVASRFSVPLSMAIRAPLETGNHSSGSFNFSARSIAATIRSHSGAAKAPIPIVGSDNTSHAFHAFRDFFCGRIDHAKNHGTQIHPVGAARDAHRRGRR